MDIVVSTPPETNAEKIVDFKEIPKKYAWEKRADLIKQKFPSIDRLDWYNVFKEDPEICGKIIGDILKIGEGNSNRPGKRPSLDPKEAAVRLRQLFGEDFSTLEFTEAFKILVGDRSIRAVAAKTGLDRNLVHRLLQGAQPTVEVMEKIAKGFNKNPGFFSEYRLLYVLSFLNKKLENEPESTVALYKRLRK